MAKKKEQAAAVPGIMEAPQETVTPETAEAPQETVTPETAGAPQETVTPETAGAPQETVTPETAGAPQDEEETKARNISEIMNDEAEFVEENAGIEEAPASPGTEGEGHPEEKILFYVRTINARTAIRSAPEYPMRGDNIVSTIEDRELHGIAEVMDGFGRLAEGGGWIMLDPGVVTRQG